MFTRRSAAKRPRPGRFAVIVVGGYATLVIAVTVLVAAVEIFAADPGFIGVWLILATQPLCSLFLLITPTDLPEPWNHITFYLSTTGAGLLQAWLLWRLAGGRAR
jgi:hypothetical protein